MIRILQSMPIQYQTQGKIDKITINVNRSLIYKFQDISN